MQDPFRQREEMMARIRGDNDYRLDAEAQGPEQIELANKVIEARDLFNAEYQDILANPQMYQWALDQEEKLFLGGDRRSPWDRYRAVGEHVRRFMAGGVVPMNEQEEIGIVRAIQMGSEDEAVAAIRQLRGTASNEEEDLEIARAIQMGSEDEARPAVRKLKVVPQEERGGDDMEADYGSAIDQMKKARGY